MVGPPGLQLSLGEHFRRVNALFAAASASSGADTTQQSVSQTETTSVLPSLSSGAPLPRIDVEVGLLQVTTPVTAPEVISPSVRLSEFWSDFPDFFWFIQTYHKTFSTAQNGNLPQFPASVVGIPDLPVAKYCLRLTGLTSFKSGDKAWRKSFEFDADDHADLSVLNSKTLYFFSVISS